MRYTHICSKKKPACSSGQTFFWSSSVYLPNGTFLANARWTHSLPSTGLLPNQVTRLQEAIKFFPLRDEDAKDLLSKYNTAVLTEKDYSCDQALREEIAQSLDNDGAISILTDARHGFRKNSKDTNVVCIGNATHKVIRENHVTRTDDQCAQRHEILGTRRLYEFFDSNIPSIGGPITVRLHAHDRNASINKFIREERPDTINQNDTLRALAR